MLLTLLAVAMLIAAAYGYDRAGRELYRPQISGWKHLTVDSAGTVRIPTYTWRTLTLAAKHEPTAALFAQSQVWGEVHEFERGYRSEHAFIHRVYARSSADGPWVERICREQQLPYAGVLAWHQRLALHLSLLRHHTSDRKATHV